MDVLTLAQSKMDLKSEGQHAYRADCPKCGQTGGFVLTRDKLRGGWCFWLNCCGDRGRSGHIKELAALLGVSNSFFPSHKPLEAPTASATPHFDAKYWRNLLHGTQRNLSPDSDGGRYLSSRGLNPATWARFGLGFGHRAGQAAILIPWFVQEHLKGGRFRLLNPASKGQRYAWWSGSETNKKLFGGHTHQARRVLVVCEGELNAMSVYQATGGAVDVLSTGSENATPPIKAEWAARWADVLCWFDKAERAQAWAAALHGRPIHLDGVDANDLRMAGELADALRPYVAQSNG